jgi:drug/metabolite transporter (DMT)-like permease
VGCVEPLMAVAAAYLVLGEHLTPLQMVGGGAIIAGVALVSRV